MMSAALGESRKMKHHAPGEWVRMYSAGRINWAEICDATGAAYGDLLVELARHAPPLPRIKPVINAQQSALLQAALNRAGRLRFRHPATTRIVAQQP
jgi:hypothetical protein